MKKLLFVSCAMLLLFGIGFTANAAPVFVDNVTVLGGWSDVNKTWTDDSNLCWAAATSNVLSYTGWVGTPDLSSSNQIFNDYKAYWDNQGGHALYGAEWWFDGINQAQGVSGWAQLEDTTHPGFYTEDLYYDNVSLFGISRNFGFETDILNSITSGNGLALGIGWMYDGVRKGGHAITIWGIDTVANYLYVTDSDDGVTALQMYSYNRDGYLTDYFGGNGFMENVFALDLWQAGSDPDPTPRPGTNPVPIPAAVWLLGSGLLGMVGVRRKIRK